MHGLLRYMMPIWLQPQTNQGRDWYPSLVLDFREGEEVVVGVPQDRGYEIPVEAGSQVAVQTALSDGIRRFTAEVLRRRDVPSPCLYLSWPERIEHIQRREHPRVEVMVPVRVRIPEQPGERPRSLDGYTADVSAGGARINLPEGLPPGRSVEVQLRIPDVEPLTCEARVVHAGQSESSRDPKRFWVAVQFAGVGADVRKVLRKFVADVQREQIRRGLL